MPGPIQLSYSHGTSSHPLLGETIGANLRRIAAAFRRAGGPGRRAVRPPVDLPRSWTVTWTPLRPACSRRGSRPGTGSASGRRTARNGCCCSTRPPGCGAILVNINPAYRTHELGYVLQQSGIRLLVSAESFKTSDYRAMIDEVRGRS